MDYTKEVIFSTIEEAVEFYKSQGFELTEDHRIVLRKVMTVEVLLTRIGPQMPRSVTVIKETDA
jgi:hypothetical protein